MNPKKLAELRVRLDAVLDEVYIVIDEMDAVLLHDIDDDIAEKDESDEEVDESEEEVDESDEDESDEKADDSPEDYKDKE